MKRILKITFSILLVFGVLFLSSCGLSEEEKAMREMKTLWGNILNGSQGLQNIMYAQSNNLFLDFYSENDQIFEFLEICEKIDMDALAGGIPEEVESIKSWKNSPSFSFGTADEEGQDRMRLRFFLVAEEFICFSLCPYDDSGDLLLNETSYAYLKVESSMIDLFIAFRDKYARW